MAPKDLRAIWIRFFSIHKYILQCCIQYMIVKLKDVVLKRYNVVGVSNPSITQSN